VSFRDRWFSVDHLDIVRLLLEWRWLCPGNVKLIARNAFGDLFLANDRGEVLRLDVAGGQLSKIAESEGKFREIATSGEKDEKWFAKSDEEAATANGLIPDERQCIGFSTPLVFAESGSGNTIYLVDIYESVGFLGDLHRQIVELPDGAKVRLCVER
jgi:hypothetical protein